MNVVEALAALSKTAAGRHQQECRLVIPIYAPGSIGGSPCVEVTSFSVGFDWDTHKLFVHTEEKLTTLTPEEVAAIMTSVREGQSWHAYQEYKKQAKRIKELEKQVKALTGGLSSSINPDTEQP